MASHSNIFAWETQWTEEPAGYTVHGVTKSQTRLSTHHSIFHYMNKPEFVNHLFTRLDCLQF